MLPRLSRKPSKYSRSLAALRILPAPTGPLLALREPALASAAILFFRLLLPAALAHRRTPHRPRSRLCMINLWLLRLRSRLVQVRGLQMRHSASDFMVGAAVPD